MKLRKLLPKDAAHMLEWMQDLAVTKFFRTDFSKMDEAAVLSFIQQAQEDTENHHFAIVDDRDQYLGTVSIKNVDPLAKTGEYAIVLRTAAQGKGAGRFASKAVLQLAFETLELEKVYLNVLTDNKRAITLYEQLGFGFEGCFRKHVFVNGERKDLSWYGIFRSEYDEKSN